MARTTNKAKSNSQIQEHDTDSETNSDIPDIRSRLRTRKPSGQSGTKKEQSASETVKPKTKRVEKHSEPEKKITAKAASKTKVEKTPALKPAVQKSLRSQTKKEIPAEPVKSSLKTVRTRRNIVISSDSDGFTEDIVPTISPVPKGKLQTVKQTKELLCCSSDTPEESPENSDSSDMESDSSETEFKYLPSKNKKTPVKRAAVEQVITRRHVKQERAPKADQENVKEGIETKDVVETKVEKKQPVQKKAKNGIVEESEVQRVSRLSVGEKVLKHAEQSRQMLGYHVSAAGGLEQAIYNATAEGCRAFAMFLRNQRQWVAKPMLESVVENWKHAVQEMKFPLEMIVPHGSYLMNPGSPDEEKLNKTREAMLDECQRAERLGIQLYNFHPGSTTGTCTIEECLATAAETINYIISNTNYITLVIETMAGAGHTIGGTFAEIRQIIDAVDNKERVGVCIDTCHIFAAGYDIRTEGAYAKTMKSFAKTIGFNYLKALHINDSKGDLGCKLDRHEYIGLGKIGKEAFSLIMNDERLRGIPMILETPEGRYVEEMIMMYNMESE